MPRPSSIPPERSEPTRRSTSGQLSQPRLVPGDVAPKGDATPLDEGAATPQRRIVPRVVMHIAAAPADPPLASLLAAEGFQLVPCPDAHALLEEVMLAVPAVVIYALRADCREDLGVLRLMRRVAPDVPLVLLAAEDSLNTRKLTQNLRPIYYAVCPLDGAELRDVIHTAVSRRGRGT